MPAPAEPGRFDAIVVGGGHNGLVAATLLGRAGKSVLVLERGQRAGGAAVSETIFPGVEARVSKYAYLVSLFPGWLLRELGVNVELRRRAVASYTPVGDSGLLEGRPKGLNRLLHRVAERIFPTLTEPLLSRDDMRRRLADDEAWEALFERPLSELIEGVVPDDDVLRGVIFTDAVIGTFTSADDPQLRQNRCFLYHVLGEHWDVPVGGMGAVSQGLERAARESGVTVRTQAEVVRIETDGARAEVTCAQGDTYRCTHVLAGVGPAVLARLLGAEASGPPEGSQLKLNMLLSRLPRLRDRGISPKDAFAGTFH
ncbi:MAG: NAD(P)/FAD-dependent oxidoreductase, partial [Solirubrobacterales bacterium]|nr:NAD(P)/FAD-dependent oxidoreductase [Solirubrobacterales bacterium]